MHGKDEKRRGFLFKELRGKIPVCVVCVHERGGNKMPLDYIGLKTLVPECCDFDSYDISLCSDEERQQLKEVLPSVKTIVVFGHHIESSIEWMWYPSKAERKNNTCGADLHLKAVVERVAKFINAKDAECEVIPYPGSCGIRFKTLASKTSMGELGDNYLFLHHEWGPWIHLRVLLTEAEMLKTNLNGKKQVCTHCNRCMESCPGRAIGERYFDGQLCGDTQNRIKKESEIPAGYLWKCEKCLRICPIGKPPAIIV